MNRTRIEKAADKYIRQGKFESAIEQLLKLVQLNPRDVTTINRVGDLYSKVGRKQEAIRYFGQIAEYYKDEGFVLKAIAIYKKITKLEPMSLDAYSCLAGLYSRQGLTMEARAQYQFVADRCLKSGNREQGLEVLREMERLYPHDVPVRLSIAELLGAMDRQEEALEVYRAVGTELDRKGMQRESRKVYEAALGLAPGDNALLRHLVASLTGQGESTPAIELLEGLLEDRPEDPELLSLLGDSHLDCDNTERATELYELVRHLAPECVQNLMNDARVCLKDGDLDGGFIHLENAMRESQEQENARHLIPYMQRLLDLEPHHLRGLGMLARLHEAVGDESACRDAYIRLAGASTEQDDLKTASSALRDLIRLDPKNPRHTERLDQVLMKLRAQGEAEGEEAAGTGTVVQVPEQAEVAEGGMGMAADDEEVAVESYGDLDGEEDAGESLDQDFIAEHLTEAEVFVKYGLIEKAIEQLRTVVGRYPHLLSAREALLEIYREEGERAGAVEECRWIARILREEGDVDGAARALAEAEQLLPGALTAEPGAPEERASDADAEEVVLIEDDEDDDYQEEDLEEEIEIEPAEETDSPSAQQLEAVNGLLEDGELEKARAALFELRSEFPDRPEMEEILNRVNLLEQEALVAAAEKQAVAEGQAVAEEQEEVGGFDLAAEMDPELFEPQVAIEETGDLAEGHAVVAAFRQGVEEQVSSEDFETHYNLGIAYKEMGLVDEAIGEFQFAAKSGEFFTRCCSMLGICFHEKGMNDLAIKWYDRGLEKAAQDEGKEMVLGLRYDLAVLHQDNGDNQRALELFTAIHGVDAAYREVSELLRDLRQSLEQD